MYMQIFSYDNNCYWQPWPSSICKRVERHTAILIRVGLDVFILSESFTLPPFVLHITYKINYAEKLWLILCGNCKCYLEVGPWKSRLKKNHRSKSHSILFFSSTTCLHSSTVHCTEIFEDCKSTYMNLWSGKNLLNFQIAFRKDFTS